MWFIGMINNVHLYCQSICIYLQTISKVKFSNASLQRELNKMESGRHIYSVLKFSNCVSRVPVPILIEVVTPLDHVR